MSLKYKPKPWIEEWKENINNIRQRLWKNALVMTEIQPFEYDTYKFKKVKGGLVKIPPRGYVKVKSPI